MIQSRVESVVDSELTDIRFRVSAQESLGKVIKNDIAKLQTGQNRLELDQEEIGDEITRILGLIEDIQGGVGSGSGQDLDEILNNLESLSQKVEDL